MMTKQLTLNAPQLIRSQRATSRPAARPVVRVRAEDKPLTEKLEDATKELVKATQENSGLNPDNLSAQPGRGDVLGTGQVDGKDDVLSFSGLLPEIINGRAAMVGMLAAFGAELATREPIFVQIQKAPVLIGGAFALVTIASLVPVLRNANLKRDGAGPFTQKAEVTNGRLAMVAFALNIVVETWKAGPGLVP